MECGLAVEAVVPEMELVTATGSWFACINVAIRFEGFAPACGGGRTRATAVCELMLESDVTEKERERGTETERGRDGDG